MAKCYRAELVGAFGCPIDENPTGVMEEAAFAAKGLNYRYLTIKVNKGDLEPAVQAVRAFNMRGVNCTIPHKVKVLKSLDELSEAAEIIGAVNTIINNDGGQKHHRPGSRRRFPGYFGRVCPGRSQKANHRQY